MACRTKGVLVDRFPPCPFLRRSAVFWSLDTAMRMFIVALLFLILITCWSFLEIRAKSKYDQARRDDAVVYSVTPMDQHNIVFLAEVQSSWKCWEDITNGADSETLKLVGKSPTVRNLIETF